MKYTFFYLSLLYHRKPIFTSVVFLFLYGKGEDTVGTVGGVLCFIQMIPLIGVVAPTEKALHKAFDKDGKKCLSQKRKET